MIKLTPKQIEILEYLADETYTGEPPDKQGIQYRVLWGVYNLNSVEALRRRGLLYRSSQWTVNLAAISPAGKAWLRDYHESLKDNA